GLEAKIPEIQKYLSEKSLYDRIKGSESVIVGEVTADRDLGLGPISEHNPAWHVATVKTTEGAVVEVRYAASHDIMWYRSPKLKIGQRAVMLLQRDATQNDLFVVDPRDVQPESALGHIQELIAHPPQPPV